MLPSPLMLEGSTRALALEVTERLAERFLSADPTAGLGPSLSHGDAGLALLHHEFEALLPDRGHRDRARECMRRALGALEDTPLEPTLFGGFVGVAWAHELLGGQGVTEYDAADCDPVDEALFELLSCDPYPRTFDLVGGVAGIAVYALERARVGRGADILAAAIRALARLSTERDGGGRAWLTLPEWGTDEGRRVKPRTYEDFGVAHGLGGIVPILAAAVALDAERAAARELLDAAVARLLSRRISGYGGLTWPAWDAVWDDAPGPTRAAWCYGDPGIATALHLAASIDGVSEWREAALAAMTSVAGRPPSACSVFDASLCHGAAGLAHLLRRWHLATGDDVFHGASAAWFARTLALAEPDQEFASFPMTELLGGEPVKVARVGLLDGTAGVALALASALNGREPLWDRAFLLSMAPLHTAASRSHRA